MPGQVLSIEWLGSALSGTRPARIVRWVAPPANELKPPPRAKRVAARPPAFGFALLRRACIRRDQAVTSMSASWTLPDIEFLVLSRKLCASRKAFSSLLNERSVSRVEPVPNRCDLALAANGRTARGRTALVPLAKRHSRRFDDSRWLASEGIGFLRCLTFEMRGGPRLAGERPLD